MVIVNFLRELLTAKTVPVKTRSQEKLFEDKIRNAFDKAVLIVENRMHDVISTGMDKVVTPRVEMGVRSMTGSSGHGPNSLFQNPNRRDFSGNTEKTRLMSASRFKY